MSIKWTVRFGAFGVLAATASAALAGPMRPVVLTGTDGPLGPGLGPGVQFANFAITGVPQAAPALTGTNFVAFAATLTGPGISSVNNEALCRWHVSSKR